MIEGIFLLEELSDGVLCFGFVDVDINDVKVEIDSFIDVKTGKENKVLSKVDSVMLYFENIKIIKVLNGMCVCEIID